AYRLKRLSVGGKRFGASRGEVIIEYAQFRGRVQVLSSRVYGKRVDVKVGQPQVELAPARAAIGAPENSVAESPRIKYVWLKRIDRERGYGRGGAKQVAQSVVDREPTIAGVGAFEQASKSGIGEYIRDSSGIKSIRV